MRLPCPIPNALCYYLAMASQSLSQNTACLSSNKNSNAQLLYNKRHFINLVVANFQDRKPRFHPLVLEAQKKQTREKNEKWKARCSDDGSCGIVPEFLPHPTVEEIVHEFYDAFKEGDTYKLEQLLSPQCVYQDLIFYGPHEGREEVINFLQSATLSLNKWPRPTISRPLRIGTYSGEIRKYPSPMVADTSR